MLRRDRNGVTLRLRADVARHATTRPGFEQGQPLIVLAVHRLAWLSANMQFEVMNRKVQHQNPNRDLSED